MLYREAGQFKTSYQTDAAIFPIRQDRIAIAVDPRSSRSSSSRSSRRRTCFTGDPDPVPDPLARRARPQHPDRLRRPALARHRGVHGGRRVRVVQLHAARPRHADPARVRRRRRRRGAGRHPVRPAEPAHPRLLSRGGHARRAVLHPVVPDQGRLGHQLQLVGRDHRAADRHPRLRVHDAGGEVPAGAVDRRA